ncbi:nerve growth factor-like [Oncorhynchus mykiss]|uniref:nerve growth factor-like n=1 Tax=Oncorhynchus mykiss TaxID=8022 RepID=UPI001878CD50|nr:nerve growth factor-like [Oncorhynchus mykiss]
MRSLLLVLLLIGIQAVLNMEGALGPVAANHSAEHHTAANGRAEQHTATNGRTEHHTAANGRAELQRTARLSVSPQQEQPAADRDTQLRPSRTRQAHRPASLPQDRSSSLGHSETDSSSSPSIPEVDPKLFSKRKYRTSSRVVFSDVPPSHHTLGGETGDEEEGVMGGGVRVRRRAGGQPMHRGEYSVCDSISVWLGNLTKATDIAGNEVEVLPEVKIDNVRKRQFFYETTCRVATPPGGGAGAGGGASGGISKAGCRGIDSRHWNSYCTNTHTYVRALTKFKEQTAWRLIRINAACVCVLSRKSWRH